MENIKNYSDFINEGKIQEKEGISPAIYKDLDNILLMLNHRH